MVIILQQTAFLSSLNYVSHLTVSLLSLPYLHLSNSSLPSLLHSLCSLPYLACIYPIVHCHLYSILFVPYLTLPAFIQ